MKYSLGVRHQRNLGQLPRLHAAKLGCTELTDRGIVRIRDYQNLQYGFLRGTRVTKAMRSQGVPEIGRAGQTQRREGQAGGAMKRHPLLVSAISGLLALCGVAAAQSDPAPRFAWAAALTGPSAQTTRHGGLPGSRIMSRPRIARGVGADGEGRVFIAGSFFGNCSLGKTELSSSGGADICVGCLSPGGDVLWFKRFGGAGTDHAFDVAADSKGNCLLTGMCGAEAQFDDVIPKTAASGDTFVAKLDPWGKVLWVQVTGGSALSGGNEICCDAQDNVLVVSNAYGAMTIGQERFPRAGGMSCLVLKYSSDGKPLWARQLAGSRRVMGRGIANDGDGNVLVAGEFIGTIRLGGLELTSADDQRDAFAAKYDGNGELKWARRTGGAGDDYARGIGGDAKGNAYVAGVAEGSRKLFLTKLNPHGEPLWTKDMPARRGEGCEIEVDSSGNSYISGQFVRDIRIGDDRLTAQGHTDMFVARFDADGNTVWTHHIPGDSAAANFAIALDKTGALTVAGSFSGALDFGGIKMRAVGGADSFIARMTPPAKHSRR